MAAITRANLSGDIKLPKGAWDSHVHVVDEHRFPLKANHHYRPGKATLDDLLSFEESIGVENVCLVCISAYGNDNRLLLESLQRLGGGGCAVVAFDPELVTEEQIDEMHELGARGVRINLKTHSARPTKDILVSKLFRYADRIRSRGWIIQLYVDLDQVELIASTIPQLGVRVVLDHMGSPNPTRRGLSQTGYTSLLELLRQGYVWVKISGDYRFSELPDLDSFVKQLIKAGPHNVVWASDWPHTGGATIFPEDGSASIQGYRQIDHSTLIKKCLEWCEFDDEQIQNLFVNNPRRLWLGNESESPANSRRTSDGSNVS